MANAFYTLGVEKILKGSISWNADTIKVALLANSYTPVLATHEFFSDLSGQVGSSVALASKTTTGGRAGAANTTFSSVTGSDVYYVGIYKDTGTGSTSPLMCLLDTGNGLPFTPNGGDIVVVWDSGANGIFLLTPWWIAAVTALATMHQVLGKIGFGLGSLFSRIRPSRQQYVIAVSIPSFPR